LKVPVNQLKCFGGITVLPVEQKEITFKISASDFYFYDAEINNFKVKPGKWEI
jgi:hypothetical protein